MTGPWPAEVAHLPVCPHRALPIPYIAEIGPGGVAEFTILDQARAVECLRDRLCAMCGRRMGGEVALLGDVVSADPDGFFIEPPVHERCGELAIGGLCPYLSRARVPRRPPQENVAIVGTERDKLTDIGRTVPKRPLLMAITGSYTAGLVESAEGGPVMVYRAGRIIRKRLFTYSDDAAGRLAEAAAPPGVRVVRTQRVTGKKRRK